MHNRRTEPFSFLFCACAVGNIKIMIQLKYILKKNRQTDFYNVGKNWFGKYRITWVKWFFWKRFVLIKMEKL